MFINNNVDRFKIRDKLLRYLKEEWGIGYNPNLERVKRDLKAFDLRALSLLYDALDWLVENQYALLKFCDSGVQRVLIHPLYELKNYFVSVDPVE